MGQPATEVGAEIIISRLCLNIRINKWFETGTKHFLLYFSLFGPVVPTVYRVLTTDSPKEDV